MTPSEIPMNPGGCDRIADFRDTALRCAAESPPERVVLSRADYRPVGMALAAMAGMGSALLAVFLVLRFVFEIAVPHGPVLLLLLVTLACLAGGRWSKEALAFTRNGVIETSFFGKETMIPLGQIQSVPCAHWRIEAAAIRSPAKSVFLIAINSRSALGIGTLIASAREAGIDETRLMPRCDHG